MFVCPHRNIMNRDSEIKLKCNADSLQNKYEIVKKKMDSDAKQVDICNRVTQNNG